MGNVTNKYAQVVKRSTDIYMTHLYVVEKIDVLLY